MELNGDWIDGVSIKRKDFKKIEKVGIWLPCGAVRPWVVGRRPQRKAVPTLFRIPVGCCPSLTKKSATPCQAASQIPQRHYVIR